MRVVFWFGFGLRIKRGNTLVDLTITSFNKISTKNLHQTQKSNKNFLLFCSWITVFTVKIVGDLRITGKDNMSGISGVST